MKYEIKGGNLPVVECTVEAGESIHCESGAMCWMSSNMQMQTEGGGLGRMFSRAISGEKMFKNVYTAYKMPGTIAFASSVPGTIVAVDIRPGQEVVCQKGAYLASTEGIDFGIFFQHKAGAGFFGGEGFIMQRLSGSGTAFLEIDGAAIEKNLAPGEQIVVDTGYLAMCDATCSIDVVTVKGVKNVLFGGEGLFNTVITGPGRVVLQTMPISNLAGQIAPFIQIKKD